MRLHLEFTIRWLFLCILQGLFVASEDMCSNTTYRYSSNGNNLKLLIKDINILPTDCSCEPTTDPATWACSFYKCSPCILGVACVLSPCSCVKVNVVDLTISPTCISTTITRISCPLDLPVVFGSCQISTKSLLSFSKKPKCGIEKKTEDLYITIQSKMIDDDDETPEQALEDGDCTAIRPTVSPNASSTTLAPATSISDTTTAKIEYRSSAESTPRPETTGSPTLVSGSMIMNMTDEPLQNPSMMSYDSGRNIGIGVGVGGGILLIIAIIIVILIFRRRRAESQKLHANNSAHSTAADPSETSYESYRVPAAVPYDNATNGVTASGYQTITYDNEPVGESNDGYTEINEPEEASDHNGYDECRIGRNEVYSMYHKTGNDLDKVSENPSMNIKNETTVIDNDLYG